MADAMSFLDIDVSKKRPSRETRLVLVLDGRRYLLPEYTDSGATLAALFGASLIEGKTTSSDHRIVSHEVSVSIYPIDLTQIQGEKDGD